MKKTCPGMWCSAAGRPAVILATFFAAGGCWADLSVSIKSPLDGAIWASYMDPAVLAVQGDAPPGFDYRKAAVCYGFDDPGAKSMCRPLAMSLMGDTYRTPLGSYDEFHVAPPARASTRLVAWIQGGRDDNDDNDKHYRHHNSSGGVHVQADYFFLWSIAASAGRTSGDADSDDVLPRDEIKARRGLCASLLPFARPGDDPWENCWSALASLVTPYTTDDDDDDDDDDDATRAVTIPVAVTAAVLCDFLLPPSPDDDAAHWAECAAPLWLSHSVQRNRELIGRLDRSRRLRLSQQVPALLPWDGMKWRTTFWFESTSNHWPFHLQSIDWTSEARSVLEIGSFEGGSAQWIQRYLISGHPESTLTVVDLWTRGSLEAVGVKVSASGDDDHDGGGGGADGGAADVFWRFSRTVCAGPHSDRVRVLQGSSTHALAGLLVEQQGGEDDVEGGRGGGGRASFDFIYIDGGHDGPQVSVDIAPPRGSFLRQLKLSLSFFIFQGAAGCGARRGATRGAARHHHFRRLRRGVGK